MFRSFAVLRNPQFGPLWFGGLVSYMGTWMQAVAVGSLVISLTDSAAWGGAVAGASFLASGVTTPFGGLLADHRDRRRILLLGSSGFAFTASFLAGAYFAGWISPWLILATVTVEGVLVGLILPASSSLLPDLVGPEHVAEASALSNASFNLGRIIGPALGGVAIAGGFYGAVFLTNAVASLVQAATVLTIHRTEARPKTAGTLGERLREGWQGVQADSSLRAAITITGVTAILVSPFIALIPAMAQIVLHGTATDTAHLTIAQGVGSVVGSLLFAAAVARFGRRRLMIALLVALPISEILFALSPSQHLALGAAFLLGATYIAISVGTSVVVQLRAPVATRARVIAINMMTLSLFYPLGAAIQGRLGDAIGLRLVMSSAAVLYLIALAAVAVSRPGFFHALDGAAPAPADSKEPFVG